jgi:hypothetical protein
MIRTSFNDAWQFRPKVNPFAELSGPAAPFTPVTLPHDAMLARDRVPAADTREGGASAYFPGGAYEYRKTFFAPAVEVYSAADEVELLVAGSCRADDGEGAALLLRAEADRTAITTEVGYLAYVTSAWPRPHRAAKQLMC